MLTCTRIYSKNQYMGVPKRLTEKQMKFAQLVVSNEGRKTGTECAIEAGYEKDTAYVRASELQSPKKYPLVVKYMGELREEHNKKYGVVMGLTIKQYIISMYFHTLCDIIY